MVLLVDEGSGISLAPSPKIEINPVLVAAMKTIARGRPKGQPWKGELARQMMREAMVQAGMDW